MQLDTPPNSDPAETAWLEGFHEAAPKQRYELLVAELKADKSVIGAEALGYAVASVNQMLAHHNLYEDMKAVTSLLETRYPEQYAAILPATHMLALDEACFENQPEKIPALLEGFLNFEGQIPEDLWLTLIDRLAYYQYGDLAYGLANSVHDHLVTDRNEEDPFQNRLRETMLLQGIETCWRNNTPTTQTDFDQLIIKLGYDQDPEIREIVYQQRDADSQAHLDILLEKFKKRATYSAIHNAQMAFGRSMLAEHNLNLYTSAEIMSHAVMLWRENPARENEDLTLKQLVKLDEKQLGDYFDAYTEESNSPDELLTLCWGLPLVYDWLQSQDLVDAAQVSELHNWLSSRQQLVIDELDGALWSYDFVHRWPRPSQVSAEDFQTESSLFRETRHQSEPLSEDPADSALFDDDEDMLNEDMLGFMMQQLSQLGPEEQEQLLGMMASEFGAEAADEMAALISDPSQVMSEFGELIKKPKP